MLEDLDPLTDTQPLQEDWNPFSPHLQLLKRCFRGLLGCGSAGGFCGVVTTPAAAARNSSFALLTQSAVSASFSEAGLGIIRAGHFMSKQSAIMRHDATGAGCCDSADANVSHLENDRRWNY